MVVFGDFGECLELKEQFARVAEAIAHVGLGMPVDGVHRVHPTHDHAGNRHREETAEEILANVPGDEAKK